MNLDTTQEPRLRAESPIAIERRKLRRVVRAVRAALRAEREEAIKEPVKIRCGDGEWWRPDQDFAEWGPDGNEQLTPVAGASDYHRLPDRASFYKHLNRELTNGECRVVSAWSPVRKRQDGH